MIRLEFDGVEVDEAPFPDPRGTTQLHTDMPSVGKDKYNRLLDNGLESLNDLYQASLPEITTIDRIGQKTAKNIKIWVGDKVVKEYEISGEQVATASVEKILELYNINERIAKEVRDQYQRKSDPGMSHISDSSSIKDI